MITVVDRDPGRLGDGLRTLDAIDPRGHDDGREAQA
jgi:hypothetical protein